jgi:hypothetical protein
MGFGRRQEGRPWPSPTTQPRIALRNVDRTIPNKSHSETTTPELAPKKNKIPTSEAEYESFANEVLFHLYKKFCPVHKVQLTRLISTRNYAVKCPKCRHQQSRFSYTPMHHLKLPLWMWGWAIWESVNRYPQVLTSSEIQRRLGIAKNSALLLKRRIQLFATQQTDRIKELMHKELQERFEDVKLPHVNLNQNVNEVLQGRSVPHVDSVVLFSASQRSNGGRKRHKHTGQTASIYMNDKLGGKQLGTLVHTLAIKNGPVILDSISNNRGETIRPLLDKYIPKDVPVFSDEGYKWYFRINKNHRMVNHNRKSEDKRYKWARNRWCINGVNNQTSEGFQRNLKWHFGAGYGYIRPEYSQLYLNEYSFWKNVKYYGWDKLILSEEENRKVAKERKFTGCETAEHKTAEKEKRATAPNSLGLKQKDGSKQRGRVKGRPDQETRFVGQNNGVIEDRNQGLEQAGTNCLVTSEEPVLSRFFGEDAPQRSGTLSGPRRGGVHSRQ